jgi:hypothetical protein
MPPTTPAVTVVADTREQTEVAFSSTSPGVEDGQRPRKRDARAFLTCRRVRRVERTSSDYDPLFSQLDLIENDYYRFRNHPSD